MIKIRNLKKTYSGQSFKTEALKEVCFDAEDGEFIAVMGASGSGKTTLLNCIGLMDEFDEGEYFLNGIAVHELTKGQKDGLRRDSISFVFQNYALMRNYTLYENIEIPLLAKNVKKKLHTGLIVEAAKRLGIKEILNKFPYQVSGGQQQRAAIARAIVADNPLILADEPTGALDGATSREIMEFMLSFKDLGKTIIMVTHDEKMAGYSDRIVRLEDGCLA